MEHDIQLREGIIALRENQIDFSDIKHFGITLDNVLIDFDRSINIHKYRGIKVAPTFFTASVLLRRLRPFIPVDTKNYQEAFLSAVTTNTHEARKKYSSIAQRSIEYFHSLGIDDEATMIEFVSDEIFLKNLEDWEEKEKDGGIKFIESELSQKLEQLGREKQNLVQTATEKEFKLKEAIREAEASGVSHQEEINKRNFEKMDLLQQKEELEKKYRDTEERFERIEKEFKISQAKIELDQKIKKYEEEKKRYVENKWNEELSEYKSGVKYAMIFLLIVGGLSIIAELIKPLIDKRITLPPMPIIGQVKGFQIGASLILIVIGLLYGIGQLTGRHLWDKYKSYISKAVFYYIRFNHKSYTMKKKQEFENKYQRENPEPE